MSRKKQRQSPPVARQEQTQDPSRFKVRFTDLKSIIPLTTNQEEFFNDYRRDKHMAYVLYGSSGTGKTYIALYHALRDVLDESTPYKKVVIVRSAVPSRDIGHLPGNEKEKTEVYTIPYQEIAQALLPRFGEKAYNKLKEQSLVEFAITSYVRGMTYEDAIIVFDEFQNANWHELNSVVTRVGDNCKLILCGDVRQNDLYNKKFDQTGFQKFMTVATHMEDVFHLTEFTEEDIVRSPFVRSWIVATNRCEDLNLVK